MGVILVLEALILGINNQLSIRKSNIDQNRGTMILVDTGFYSGSKAKGRLL
jgi:hypothetical protein